MLVLLVWAYCESFALMRVVHSAKICEGGERQGGAKTGMQGGGPWRSFFPKIHGQSATNSRPTAQLLNGTIPNLKHPGQAGKLAIRQIKCLRSSVRYNVQVTNPTTPIVDMIIMTKSPSLTCRPYISAIAPTLILHTRTYKTSNNSSFVLSVLLLSFYPK